MKIENIIGEKALTIALAILMLISIFIAVQAFGRSVYEDVSEKIWLIFGLAALGFVLFIFSNRKALNLGIVLIIAMTASMVQIYMFSLT